MAEEFLLKRALPHRSTLLARLYISQVPDFPAIPLSGSAGH
jgi:hypothetical protein